MSIQQRSLNQQTFHSVQQREFLWQVELARDQNVLESPLVQSFVVPELKTEIAEMVIAILRESLTQNYSKSLKLAELLWEQAEHPDLQMFALNWAVTNCEDLCDYKKRNLWLKRWPQITSWLTCPWSRYLFQFHKAVSFYFTGSLREAINLFQECANIASTISYHRGLYRAHFHIGLCNFYLRRRQAAIREYEQCHKLADELKAVTMLARVSREQNAIQSGLFGTLYKQQILHFILKKQFPMARALYLQESRRRRQSHLPREAESDLAFLAILLFSMKREQRYKLVLSRITDLFVLENVLYFIYQNLSATTVLRAHLLEVQKLLGLTGLEVRAEGLYYHQTQIRGAEVGSEVYEFVYLLQKSGNAGSTKAEICKTLWNYDYDPTIHDSKIYKLVNKTKMLLGSDEFIENRRGSYRIAFNLMQA